jgi:starch phosphorylase
MKAALNGALQCSVLDGWWDEWYEPGIGWAIPSSDWLDESDARNATEAGWVYDLLEREVVPLFFARDAGAPPAGWLARVKASLAALGPRVSADRMVREYVERYYEPLASRNATLRADAHGRARRLAAWRARLRRAWPSVAVVEAHADEHDPALGDALEVRATARLGELDESEVRLEIVHGSVDPDGELRAVGVVPMARDVAAGDSQWRGSLLCDRGGAFGFAVRAVPAHPDLESWLDLGLVAWAPWPDLRRQSASHSDAD